MTHHQLQSLASRIVAQLTAAEVASFAKSGSAEQLQAALLEVEQDCWVLGDKAREMREAFNMGGEKLLSSERV